MSQTATSRDGRSGGKPCRPAIAWNASKQARAQGCRSAGVAVRRETVMSVEDDDPPLVGAPVGGQVETHARKVVRVRRLLDGVLWIDGDHQPVDAVRDAADVDALVGEEVFIDVRPPDRDALDLRAAV